MGFLLCMIFGHRREATGTYNGHTLYRCKTCKRYSTYRGEVEGFYE